jgi:hypothetical protein
LQSAWFKAVEDAPGAVHVHAAQRNHALSDPAKRLHEVSGLALGAENEIDDHIEVLSPQSLSVLVEAVAIPSYLLHVGWNCSIAAVKDDYFMTVRLELASRVRTDKSRSSNHQYLHLLTPGWHRQIRYLRR